MAVELDLSLYNANTWLYPFAHLFTTGLCLMLGRVSVCDGRAIVPLSWVPVWPMHYSPIFAH